MNKRVALLASFLAASYVLVGWLRSAPDTTTESATIDLSYVSQKIDAWSGEDIAIQDETVQVLKAQSFINRIYRDATGQELSVHIANWTNPVTISAAPHHPEVCYPAAGWEVIERRTVQIGSAPDVFPMELILFRKGERRVVTGHWFKVGAVAFVSSDGFQRQRHRFWGQQTWPDTTKFLIQASAPSIESAEDLMTRFAVLVAKSAEATEPSPEL